LTGPQISVLAKVSEASSPPCPVEQFLERLRSIDGVIAWRLTLIVDSAQEDPPLASTVESPTSLTSED